jgi:hypothetical protein
MTEPYDPNETLAAARRLETSMGELHQEMHRLRVYGRRNRHLIWALAGSILFDVALSILLFFVFVVAGNARDAAARNRENQIETCEANNQSRQVTTNLWNYILDTASKNPENQTEAKRKQIADFRAYMAHAYAPRDCTKVGS